MFGLGPGYLPLLSTLNLPGSVSGLKETPNTMSLSIESGEEFEPVSRRSPSEMGYSLHARKLDRTAAWAFPCWEEEFSGLAAKHNNRRRNTYLASGASCQVCSHPCIRAE